MRWFLDATMVGRSRFLSVERLRTIDKLGLGVFDDLCLVYRNETRQFHAIMHRTGVNEGEFHDFRRTRLTWWFRDGLSEFDIMTLAGHSDFNTTRRSYLAVREDMLDRTRKATEVSMPSVFGAHLERAPAGSLNEKRPSSLSA